MGENFRLARGADIGGPDHSSGRHDVSGEGPCADCHPTLEFVTCVGDMVYF